MATHTRSSSVADIRAMFENNSINTKNKPKEKVTSRRHSSSDFWENVFKTKQPELRSGPSKIHKEWEREETKYESKSKPQLNPGKIGQWNPQIKSTQSNQREVGKLSISAQFEQQINECIEKKDSDQEDVTADPSEQEEDIKDTADDKATKEEVNVMMTCAPEEVIPPSVPQAPSKEARAYFSDQWIGPGWAIPYDTTGPWASISDYVGAGSYPNNREAFPNASRGTFDAIAIDSNTRVILWEKPNFEGNVLLDQTGPALVMNSHCYTEALLTDTFKDPEIEKNYPPSVRIKSATNMQLWTSGSVKIVAAAK